MLSRKTVQIQATDWMEDLVEAPYHRLERATGLLLLLRSELRCDLRRRSHDSDDSYLIYSSRHNQVSVPNMEQRNEIQAEKAHGRFYDLIISTPVLNTTLDKITVAIPLIIHWAMFLVTKVLIDTR